MKTLQAIEKMKYLKPGPLFVCHSRVVELHPEETAPAAYNENIHQDTMAGKRLKSSTSEMRKYKCLDCGRTWREDIYSPLIVTPSQIQGFYHRHIGCTVLVD